MVWLKHYSSSHDILLVGEGDFSFSLSLANSFGSAVNIVATSLNSRATLAFMYSRAMANLDSLEEMGATVLHGVDATTMELHPYLMMRKFDRIVFNFPHAGFKGKEGDEHMINLHKQIVSGFFKNSSRMLRPFGEVHVTHKTHGPYHKWKIQELASKNSLVLSECADFKIEDYPGYNNKRGDGALCDHAFSLGKCCTFKFRVSNMHNIKKAARSNMGSVCGRSLTKTVESGDGPRDIGRTEHPLANQFPEGAYMFNMWERPRTDPTISVEDVPGECYYSSGVGIGISPLSFRTNENGWEDDSLWTYENDCESDALWGGYEGGWEDLYENDWADVPLRTYEHDSEDGSERDCPPNFSYEDLGHLCLNDVNAERCGTAYDYLGYPLEPSC